MARQSALSLYYVATAVPNGRGMRKHADDNGMRLFRLVFEEVK